MSKFIKKINEPQFVSVLDETVKFNTAAEAEQYGQEIGLQKLLTLIVARQTRGKRTKGASQRVNTQVTKVSRTLQVLIEAGILHHGSVDSMHHMIGELTPEDDLEVDTDEVPLAPTDAEVIVWSPDENSGDDELYTRKDGEYSSDDKSPDGDE